MHSGPAFGIDVHSFRALEVRGFIGYSEDKAEGWSKRSKFGRGREGKVHLKSARQEKRAIDPAFKPRVDVMDGSELVMHVRCPV